MIKNPAVVLVLIWAFVYFLFSLRLSKLIQPMDQLTLMLLVYMSVCFFIVWGVFSLIYNKISFSPKIDYDHISLKLSNHTFKKRLRKLVYLFIIVSFFELILAGNLPFLSLFGVGKFVGYTQYGIKGLHGFINAIQLALINVCVLNYIISKEKKFLIIIALHFIWAILLVNRQFLLSAFVQVMFVYIIVVGVKPSTLFKVLFMSLFTIVVFGYIGDIRSDREFFIMVAEPTFDYPDYMPSGFLWVYIYMVTPLNNLNFGINNFTAHYYPYSSLILLLPSIFRGFITDFTGYESNNFPLYMETFNMSSFFPTLLGDFGFEFLFIPFFIFFAMSFYASVKMKRNVTFFLFLVFLNHAAIFSIFTNFFTHIVFVFQIFVYIYLFNIRSKRENGRGIVS
jgi:oligosaccharide repeat unit polymerase